MGGDGASGLALMIGIGMLLMLVGGALLFAFLGRALARNAAPGRRRLVMALAALAGVGAGLLLVVSTFYESTWSPPPHLTLVTPPGFDAPFVILLEDPRAPSSLEWRGSWLPFTTTTAEIAVPASGIVRLRDFGAMEGRGDLGIGWSNGQESFSAAGGPAPAETGARTYIMIQTPGSPHDEALESLESAAIAAYIRRREAGRQPLPPSPVN